MYIFGIIELEDTGDYMNNFIKKNINIIVCIFILIQPILDLITGVCLHVLNINFTLGIIIKVAFLLFIMLICVFIFKKKKLLVPYLIVGIYSILYTIGMIIYKDSSLFTEIQNSYLKWHIFKITNKNFQKFRGHTRRNQSNVASGFEPQSI